MRRHSTVNFSLSRLEWTFFSLGQPSSFRRWKKLVSYLFEGLFLLTLFWDRWVNVAYLRRPQTHHNIVYKVLSRNEIPSVRSIGELKQVWDMWHGFMLWLLSSKDAKRNKIVMLNLCSESCQEQGNGLGELTRKRASLWSSSSWKP